MTDVRIGNYQMTVCDEQFKLCEVKVAKTGKNKGQETLGTPHYYPKLSQVADKIFHLEIAASDATTLQEIEKTVRATRKLIDSAGWTRLDFK